MAKDAENGERREGSQLAEPKLAEFEITAGNDVKGPARKDAVSVFQAGQTRGRHALGDLVSRIPADYEAEEVNWGKATGKEVW